MASHRFACLLALALTGPVLGCASGLPGPIVSKAPLGRVIIYRNGVAYFERYAAPGETELTLRVPSERVDDFLKSLSIVDRKTGETMPASYPTRTSMDGSVLMTIKLPERHNGLRISYVTESPSWKPSYRLVMGDGGKATLQGWAVVDNVSGEDWKHVAIGVGSTSALSFRYDLHSVRLVQRETLSTGSLLAAAPPTGGSPYTTGEQRMRVLANLDDDAIAGLVGKQAQHREAEKITGGAGRGKSVSRDGGGDTGLRTVTKPPAEPPAAAFAQSPQGSVALNLANQLRASNERVRIEGFAQAGDKDPKAASLDRANKLRTALIDNGVAADRIDAVGTGKLDEQQAARVVTVDGEPEAPKGGERGERAEEAQPLGHAHFVSSEPLTILADHSAMVSILAADTKAERVYYYDPISERGSKRFAFNAVRIENPSRYTLDSGPFTVYAKGQFLGEGLAEPILPRSTAFIPFALDRTVLVEPQVTGREEIDKLISIQRGIVTTETRKIRTTKLDIVNRGREPATVYVRHKTAPGHRLAAGTTKFEKLGGALLFPVSLKAGESVVLTIEEWTPIQKTVDINHGAGIKAIALYLKNARLDAALKSGLQEVVRRHTDSADLEQRVQLLGEQMQVYRARIDEINFQLVSLNKVREADRLKRHLTDKMQEISDKLQSATMEVSELKGRLMTARIELQDKLAELTLAKPGAGSPEKHARKE